MKAGSSWNRGWSPGSPPETSRFGRTRRSPGAADFPSGRLELDVGRGRIRDVDQVILATGYTVDLTRVPLLTGGDLLPRVAVRDGSPVLDEAFQTTAPGLYVTSFPAARDFGPFGFTVSVRASAAVIGNALLRR